MINYTRLSDLEREDISRMLSQKYSFRDIAKALDRNVSTISREVVRGVVINIPLGQLRPRIEREETSLKERSENTN